MLVCYNRHQSKN